jgi:hypothetical protein
LGELDRSQTGELSSGDDKSTSQPSAILADQISASPCSESVSFIEKPEVLPQTTGVLVKHESQSSSQASMVEAGWLDCKSEVIPIDLHAVLVESCQLLNPHVPTLFISQPSLNTDVSGAVFVEMDTDSCSIAASTSGDQAPVAAIDLQPTLPDQYTLTIDHSAGSDTTSLPVLMGNENYEVMLTDGAATAMHNGLDSSVITCPVITDDSLASVQMTALPTSRVVLFSPAYPEPSTPTYVPAGTYQVIQDANQLSAAFPSPCTPSTSDVVFTSLQGLSTSQITNPVPGTPVMIQAAYQPPAAIDQLSASFPTPPTPGQSQLKTPTGTNYFKFSSANACHTSGVTGTFEPVTLPQTPVYTVAFTHPVMGRQLFSPRTPYTPATPSIFQFPPTVSAMHDSTGKCSSPFVIQKHLTGYHPYNQAAAMELSGPHFQRMQQQAAMRKEEERKKFEQDVAEAHLEIEHHLKQLKQEDMIRQQQKQHSGLLLISESQVIKSNPDGGSELNVPASNTTSNTVTADLHQRVDDVFQVLAEQTDEMDTVHSDFTVIPNAGKTDCVSLLSACTSDIWISDFQNPTDSLKKMKRKQKPEPLVIPDSMSNFKHVENQVTQSQFPAVRSVFGGTRVAPYTPPPMRSPLWTGLGVNKSLVKSNIPSSAPAYKSAGSGKICFYGNINTSLHLTDSNHLGNSYHM